MSPVELGVRYRAGRDVVTITMRDGRVVQLEPFGYVRFLNPPLRVEGKLYRDGGIRCRSPRRHETKVA